MLPYITVSELEQLENSANDLCTIYTKIDCGGVNFDTSDASKPLKIPGIWLNLSKNKKLCFFQNYKIDDVAMQANIANAEVAQDEEGYYLHYSSPYGEFFVRPNDDVWFVPKTIKLRNIVPAGTKFTKLYDISTASSSFGTKHLTGFRYIFPAGTLPNRISPYILKCSVTLNGPRDLRGIPLAINAIKNADGTFTLVMSAQVYFADGHTPASQYEVTDSNLLIQ